MISVPIASAKRTTCHDLLRWHTEFQRAVFDALRRNARDASCRDAALQELWLAVLQSPPPRDVIADDARLLAWLTGAARRRLLDHLRRENRRRQTSLIDDVADGTDSEHEETACRVHAVLATMSEGKDRDAGRLLELRFIDGRSVADIARELNISPRAVSARLQRAKQKFRIAWTEGGVAIKQAELFGRISASHFGVSCDYSVTPQFSTRFAMMRKLVRLALLLCTIVCVMGASTVAYDANQPNPNPGGKASTLEAKGTYTLGQNEMFLSITHFATESKTKQTTSKMANANNGKWDTTMALVAGNYDCQAWFDTMDNMMQFQTVKTASVNVNLK